MSAIIELALFAAKGLLTVLFIVAILIAFFALLAKGKQKLKGHLQIKSMNKHYDDTRELILSETLDKKAFKQYLKEKKASDKQRLNATTPQKNVYVLHFNGDIKASAVSALREEIDAIINVAKKDDEVVLCLESAGGIVHGYGLAAAQLMRLRTRGIYLTVAIDKVAASGGYMMACVANKLIAAPFAIVGSIGVLVQVPNFNKLLKENHVEFEQLTAGQYKRTITMFGENTPEGREKLQQELEDIHHLFKKHISTYRPNMDIQQIATGEHWLGEQALDLKLIDGLQTSDDYLLSLSQDAKVFAICYELKKPFYSVFLNGANALRAHLGF